MMSAARPAQMKPAPLTPRSQILNLLPFGRMSIIMSAALMIEPDEAAYLAAWKVRFDHLRLG